MAILKKAEVRPAVYFFDDDPVMVAAVTDVIDSVVDMTKELDDCLLTKPELEVGRTDADCLALINSYVRKNSVPLFIVDLNIDSQDSGINLVRAIRKRRALRFAPIIMLTSHWEKDVVNDCYKTGANSYIVKGDNPEELEHRIETLVRFWLLNVSHSRALSLKNEDKYFKLVG